LKKIRKLSCKRKIDWRRSRTAHCQVSFSGHQLLKLKKSEISAKFYLVAFFCKHRIFFFLGHQLRDYFCDFPVVVDSELPKIYKIEGGHDLDVVVQGGLGEREENVAGGDQGGGWREDGEGGGRIERREGGEGRDERADRGEIGEGEEEGGGRREGGGGRVEERLLHVSSTVVTRNPNFHELLIKIENTWPHKKGRGHGEHVECLVIEVGEEPGVGRRIYKMVRGIGEGRKGLDAGEGRGREKERGEREKGRRGEREQGSREGEGSEDGVNGGKRKGQNKHRCRAQQERWRGICRRR
jgi:hypothetical protein